MINGEIASDPCQIRSSVPGCASSLDKADERVVDQIVGSGAVANQALNQTPDPASFGPVQTRQLGRSSSHVQTRAALEKRVRVYAKKNLCCNYNVLKGF